MMGANRSFEKRLKELCSRNILIIGIGNTLKGDDGAGSVICQQLKETFPDRIIDAGTVPENYIQPIIDRSPEILLIIDAVDFGASGGDVKVFSPDEISSVTFSTHSVSPRLFLDVICQSISPETYFLGIQPVQTGLNEPFSPEVNQTINSLTNFLLGSLK